MLSVASKKHSPGRLYPGTIEGEAIRCRYHGWKYAGDGQCLEQPAELEKQFCGKVRLGSWPTRIYKGLVFAYLGEGPAPEFPEFPHLDGDGIIETNHYRRGCNFFNSIDNQFDESHVNFTHPYQFRRIPELPVITYEKTDFGAMLFSARPGKGVRARQFVMPNVLRLKVPSSDDPEVYWTDYVNWRVPVDDTAHYTFGIRYIDVHGAARERYLARRKQLRGLPVPPIEELADSILRGEATLEEVEAGLGEIDLSYKINLEDHVTQVGQGTIANRSAECLGSADAGVRLLRELWYDALDRVAAGERPKTYSRLPDVEITSGDIADFATAGDRGHREA